MPHFRESSALRSNRDPADLSRVHIRLEEMTKQIIWLGENMKKIQGEMNRLRIRKGGEDSPPASANAVVFYPFQVYLSPAIPTLPGQADKDTNDTHVTLTTDDADLITRIADAIEEDDGPVKITGSGIASGTEVSAIEGDTDPVVTLSKPITANVDGLVRITLPNAWRTFRVRAGRVGLLDVGKTDGDGVDSSTNGDDGEGLSPNLQPDTAGIPPYDTDIDFVAGTEHLVGVWIDRSDTEVPVIGHGYIKDDWTPSTDTGYTPDGPTAWWTDKWILLAVIDARIVVRLTSEGPGADKKTRVRQFRRSDIPMVSGCVNGGLATVPV